MASVEVRRPLTLLFDDEIGGGGKGCLKDTRLFFFFFTVGVEYQ